jgi:hypothetical protein
MKKKTQKGIETRASVVPQLDLGIPKSLKAEIDRIHNDQAFEKAFSRSEEKGGNGESPVRNSRKYRSNSRVVARDSFKLSVQTFPRYYQFASKN